MSRIIQVLMISQIALAAGCAFKEDTGPEKPETQPSDVIETIEKGREAQAKNLTLAPGEAKLEFLEGAAGFYFARLSWPDRVPRVQVTKSDDARPILVADKNEYTEIVTAGQKVSFGLAIADAMGITIQSIRLDGTAPKDLQVAEVRKLDQDTLLKYNRIFFYEGGKFVSNGYNLSIEAKKLIFVEKVKQGSKETFFDGAHIITHYPDTFLNGEIRRENSKINIDADYAEGELVLMMIGPHGRNGKSGNVLAKERGLSLSVRDAALAGAKGNDGVGLISGRPCMRGMEGMDIVCEQPRPFCSVQPTSGLPGKKGAQGLKGEPGEDGGDTGSVYFKVADHSKFKVLIYSRPGKPGAPGPGGDGLLGGAGGQPGAAPEGCVAASAGPNGPKGDKGPNGSDGREGRIGPYESSFPISERAF